MSRLTIAESRSTGLLPGLESLRTIDIEATPFAKGGFGEVYVCSALDRARPTEPLVIKLLVASASDPSSPADGYATLCALQDGLIAKEAERLRLGQPSLSTVTGLFGVPQFTFIAEHQGSRVFGCGMRNLKQLGYFPLDDVMSLPVRRKAYNLLSGSSRLKIVTRFLEGAAILREIGLIHGDVNAPNIFVDLQGESACLIDFDAGCIQKSPLDRPRTPGKRDEWLAPEVQASFSQATPLLPDAHADDWSIGIGVHMLLFLFHPLFFLRDFGVPTLQSYFAQNRWPDIAPYAGLGLAQNEPIYRRWHPRVASLPAELKILFSNLLDHGAMNPALRPSAADWFAALSEPSKPPRIAFLTADKMQVVAGKEVELLWHVDDAEALELSGVGDVTGKGGLKLALQKDATFTLLARNSHGTVQKQIGPIRVLVPPQAKRFCAPCTTTMRTTEFFEGECLLSCAPGTTNSTACGTQLFWMDHTSYFR